MRKQKPRTYKTLKGATKYAHELAARYPGKRFSAMPDPRAGSFCYVVALQLNAEGSFLKEPTSEPPRFALCA